MGTRTVSISDPIYNYLKEELCRYVPASRLEDRIEDRLTECAAKGYNPLDWAYCENTETVNFKTSTYFHWEKKHGR